MRVVPILATMTALSTLPPALPAGPEARASRGICCGGDHVRFARHQDLGQARFAMDTRDGKVTLVLTDRVVAFQLSERTLHKVRRELRQEVDEQDDPIGRAIAVAVIGTVRGLIDHSLACPVRELRDVFYRDGRLTFVARSGRRLFEDMDVCDDDVAESFSERDALAFVREFHRLKAEMD